MKQVINGKRYNTETAEDITTHWNGVGANDFNYIHETLYRTPRGNWFLYAEGGANTKYAERVGGNNWSGSQKIIPLDDGQVYDWLERHGKTSELEAYFPDSIEDA